MRDVIQRQHYSIRTKRSYCVRVERYVFHFNMKFYNDLCNGENKIESFLSQKRILPPPTKPSSECTDIFVQISTQATSER